MENQTCLLRSRAWAWNKVGPAYPVSSPEYNILWSPGCAAVRPSSDWNAAIGVSAAVEAEDELVDVVRQMLGADAVVGAREPGLEVREDAVDPREQLRGVLRVALGGRLMVVGLSFNLDRDMIGFFHPKPDGAEITSSKM